MGRVAFTTGHITFLLDVRGGALTTLVTQVRCHIATNQTVHRYGFGVCFVAAIAFYLAGRGEKSQLLKMENVGWCCIDEPGRRTRMRRYRGGDW